MIYVQILCLMFDNTHTNITYNIKHNKATIMYYNVMINAGKTRTNHPQFPHK